VICSLLHHPSDLHPVTSRTPVSFLATSLNDLDDETWRLGSAHHAENPVINRFKIVGSQCLCKEAERSFLLFRAHASSPLCSTPDKSCRGQCKHSTPESDHAFDLRYGTGVEDICVANGLYGCNTSALLVRKTLKIPVRSMRGCAGDEQGGTSS